MIYRKNNLLLFCTETSRYSSNIIEEQKSQIVRGEKTALEATHRLNEEAFRMKEALLKGRINEIGEILHEGFENKRRVASHVSTPLLGEIYQTSSKAGATGGKVSGAGGGGFMLFYCPGNTRHLVKRALFTFQGRSFDYHFIKHGLV